MNINIGFGTVYHFNYARVQNPKGKDYKIFFQEALGKYMKIKKSRGKEPKTRFAVHIDGSGCHQIYYFTDRHYDEIIKAKDPTKKEKEFIVGAIRSLNLKEVYI